MGGLPPPGAAPPSHTRRHTHAQGKRPGCDVCGYVPAPKDRGAPCVPCTARLVHSKGNGVLPSGAGGSDLAALVETLSARSDGWIRIVPDLEGGAHWKYRFTSGAFAGCYVYWRQAHYETAASGWRGLERKLHLVDAGELRPTRDRFYEA